jgi:nucleoside-diphosphate-sugar epimerase
MTKILITGGNGNLSKIIKKNLSDFYEIICLSRQDLDILNLQDLKNYIEQHSFDILVHTAIGGGRRTKAETGEITHNNLVMFENILKFADKFKMIINFDSGAIYDRSSNILNRKENELFTVPTDYYGFSKYVIFNRSLQFNNIFNFRIFNIFHVNEEKDRFIKSCFSCNKNKTKFKIFENKYFDFFYEDDFIKIIKYYFDNIDNLENLHKTINISYEKKFTLFDIAKLIIKNDSLIEVHNNNMINNYSGDSILIESFGIDFLGLENSLTKYEELLNII